MKKVVLTPERWEQGLIERSSKGFGGDALSLPGCLGNTGNICMY